MNYDVVIPASGSGTRASLGYNKVFYRMKDGKSILEHASSLFIEDDDCRKIVIVTNEESFDDVFRHEKLVLVKGGETRKDSVYNGLLNCDSEYVLIHDGARPFLDKRALEKVKEKVVERKAVVLGKIAVDTIKLIEGDKVVKTLDRNQIFMAETPQAFDRKLLLECYERCEDIEFTDDVSLAESLGHEVSVVIDEYDNRKLTRKEDFRDL